MNTNRSRLTETRRAEIIEYAWRTGNLRWKLRPGQRLIYDAIAKKNVGLKYILNASRRIGKSTTFGLISLETAIQNQYAPIRFAAPTQKALRNITRPIFRKLLTDCPQEFKPTYKTFDQLFKFPNGSEIHISGANNGHDESLRGTESILSVVDEAGFVKNLSYLVTDILMPQHMTTGGRILIGSTPPPTPAHDFVDLIGEAKLNGNYGEFDIYKSDYPLALIESYKKEAGGELSTTWQREYLCQLVVDKNMAIVPEWNDSYVQDIPRSKFFQFYQTYVSMDIGGRDKTAILFAYYDYLNARLVIERELIIEGPQTTTDMIQAQVKATEKDLWDNKSVWLRVADNNNVIMLQDLSLLHDVSFSPTSKDNLHSMVSYLRLWISQGKILVHPSCKETIGCLAYGVWDDKRKEFARSNNYGHFDALASLVYLVRNIDVVTNPIPSNFEMLPQDYFVPEVKPLAHDAQEIKRLFSRSHRG